MKSFNISMQSSGGVGTIDIFGIIGAASFWDDTISAKSFRRNVSHLGKLTRLDVHIHSPGGSILEGLAIFNTLDQHPADVHTFNDGLAGSMASLIMLAGDTRHMASNAWNVVHLPTGVAEGTAEEVKRQAKVIKMHEDNIIQMYADSTKLSINEVTDLLKKEDTWLNAKESLEKGFIDQIGEKIELDVAALTDISQFSNAPAMLLEVNSPADPDTKEGSVMEITLEMVRKHPDIVKVIQAEVKIPDVKAEVKTAVEAECARIKDVVALSRPGVEDLVLELAFNGSTTKADAALKILDKLDSLGMEAFKSKKAESNDPEVPDKDDKSGSVDFSGMTLEAKAKKMWEDNISKCRDEFMDQDGLLAFMKADGEGRIKILHHTDEEAA